MDEQSKPRRILREPVVRERTGTGSRVSLWRRVRARLLSTDAASRKASATQLCSWTKTHCASKCRRGDLREKRRKLMEAWAAYCAAPAKSGKVVQLKRASD
jgi:hypothetical protein